ncbi:MAG: ABC transporter permease [Thermoplasmata archaeon]|nr:ABC transporter permease [Thermoplasmata archaeon]
MSLLNIVKKEVKELLTPATVLPVVLMFIIFAGMGNFFGEAAEKAKEMPKIGLACNDDGNASKIFVDVMKAYCNIVTWNNSIEEVKERKGFALIEVPSNFSSNIENFSKAGVKIYWVINDIGIANAFPYETIKNIIEIAEREIANNILEERKINASFVSNPINEEELTVFKEKEIDVSPSVILQFFSTQSTTVPIIVMIIILTSGGMVITSMGMEKENKTLETLLTLPVKRSNIIAGKIMGAAIVGFIIAMIYMAGFGYYISSFSGEKIDLSEYGLKLDILDYVFISLSLFSSLLAGLSLCIVIGAFAKNYKSAQTLTLPISALAIIPMFLIMFKGFASLPFSLKTIIFAIPFSHPMMAPSFLLLDAYSIVVAGIAYSFIFSLICIAIAAYIFKTDLLLVGMMRNGKKLFWKR